MSKWTAYWQLMRMDKPVGILLLWFPTAWALWFANQGWPPYRLLILFFLGTVLMRAAGCVLNDIADRHVDKHVARTHLRPLTSGRISLSEAFALLFGLLSAALLVLIYLPGQCFYLALIALFISVAYPFCKRFLQAPQLVLGLAFSMGIPMAYVASGVGFDSQFILLCLINFTWILAYDTMYAMADREDDLRIGVKSMAIYLARFDCLTIFFLQISLNALWLVWALLIDAGTGFYFFWGLALGVFAYQQFLIQNRKPEQCLKAFRISVYYGLLLWMAVIAAF